MGLSALWFAVLCTALAVTTFPTTSLFPPAAGGGGEGGDLYVTRGDLSDAAFLTTPTARVAPSPVLLLAEAQRRPPRPQFVADPCVSGQSGSRTIRNNNGNFCSPGIANCSWLVRCGKYCILRRCSIYSADIVRTYLRNISVGVPHMLEFYASATPNLSKTWIQYWAGGNTRRVQLGRGGRVWPYRITVVPKASQFWLQFSTEGVWISYARLYGPEGATYSNTLSLAPTVTSEVSTTLTRLPTQTALPTPSLALTATRSAPRSASSTLPVPPPTPSATLLATASRHAASSTRTATVSLPPHHIREATATQTLLPEPQGAGGDPRGRDGDTANDDGDVRATSVAASGAVIFAISALAPGTLSAGAVGAPARLAALARLLLCQQVENPPFTLLPGSAFTDDARSSIFTELAQRAACVAVACVGLCLLAGMALVRRGTKGVLSQGFAQACFVIPAFYAGPAVTGVASQLLSIHLQPGTLQPVDAGSGAFLEERPTSSDVTIAFAAAVAMWIHMALVAYSTVLLARDAAAGGLNSILARMGASLDEIVCGRMRTMPRRRLCGLLALRSREKNDGTSSLGQKDVNDDENEEDDASRRANLLLRCVVVLEVTVAHVFELLAGIRGPHRVCLGRSVAALASAVLFLVYVAYMQPLASRLEHSFQLGLGLIQAAAGVLLVAAVAGDATMSQDAAAAGEWATTAGVWFVIVQAVVLAIESLVLARRQQRKDLMRQTGNSNDGNGDELTAPTGLSSRAADEPLLRVVPTLTHSAHSPAGSPTTAAGGHPASSSWPSSPHVPPSTTARRNSGSGGGGGGSPQRQRHPSPSAAGRSPTTRDNDERRRQLLADRPSNPLGGSRRHSGPSA